MGGAVIFDLIGYKNGDFVKDHQGFGNIDVMRDPVARGKLTALSPDLRRYRLDMQTASADRVSYHVFNVTDGQQAFDIEMPRYNDRMHQGRAYCFAYAISSAEHGIIKPNLVKIDLCNGGRAKPWYEPNQFPSEAVFVPRPGATEEDDGVLVTSTLD